MLKFFNHMQRKGLNKILVGGFIGLIGLVFLFTAQNGLAKSRKTSETKNLFSKLVSEGQILEDEIILQVDKGSNIDVQRDSRINGLSVSSEKITTDKDPISGIIRVKLAPGITVADALTEYNNLPGVSAGPNVIYHSSLTPDDSYFDSQWALHNTGQTGGTSDADIDAPSGWDNSTGDSSVVIAIVDSGTQLDHTDLADRIWENPSEVSAGICTNNNSDDDGNGYKDDCYGYDFVSTFNGSGSNSPRDNDPSPCGTNIHAPNTSDCNGVDDDGAGGADNLIMHGTHVAGIAAATQDNTFGISGVAPGVKIMPIRTLTEDGIGITSDVIAGMNYAISEGADVINMSFGAETYDSSFDAVVSSAINNDVVLVAAAGNKNENLVAGSTCDSPVCNDDPNDNGANGVLGVASSTDRDRKSSFSNYSTEGFVDVIAPGSSILSTCYDTTTSSSCFGGSETGSEPNEFSRMSGTSMATPHVAGAAALLRSSYPSLSASEIIEAIKLSGDNVTAANDNLGACGGSDCTTGETGTLGHGRLNINNFFGPLLVGASPSKVDRGKSKTVSLTGINTSFNGTSTVDFGEGIAVNSFSCSSSTSCSANITVSNSAPLGPHEVKVTTGAEVVKHATVFGVAGSILRLSGDDRIATGITISKNYYPITNSAKNVIIARKDNFPDSLAGAPLASLADGPILFTDSTSLDSRVASEINRLLHGGKSAKIYILGGTVALNSTVENQLKALSSNWTIKRLAGTDRYDTARKIADETNVLRGGKPNRIILTPGTDFPDALAAAVPASDEALNPNRIPIILTKKDTLPQASLDYLAGNASGINSGYAVGGPAVLSDAVLLQVQSVVGSMERLWGNDRYLTAQAVAERFYSNPVSVSFASGLNFPDAQAGGPHSGSRHSPLLLIKGSQTPQATFDYVSDKSDSILGGFMYGGTSVIPNNVKTFLEPII